ncbi:uncharacterized protein G2W53_030535 [Senna tora]|uniref:Uncharacterized protein n=1 Tax=Senna tora TaxID=362788 RepID=A0A834T7M1_9FABA|nr:uncharacterized protein G2W53_030535 [Senna tora]
MGPLNLLWASFKQKALQLMSPELKVFGEAQFMGHVARP